jgi:hypothetical protein
MAKICSLGWKQCESSRSVRIDPKIEARGGWVKRGSLATEWTESSGG